jgi:hypothetical protein
VSDELRAMLDRPGLELLDFWTVAALCSLRQALEHETTTAFRLELLDALEHRLIAQAQR